MHVSTSRETGVCEGGCEVSSRHTSIRDQNVVLGRMRLASCWEPPSSLCGIILRSAIWDHVSACDFIVEAEARELLTTRSF